MKKRKKIIICLTVIVAVIIITIPTMVVINRTGRSEKIDLANPAQKTTKRDIPEPNEDINIIGADMPYTRYDSGSAETGGGARLKESKDFSQFNLASQASEQSYIELPRKGAYAEWTMDTEGDGVTMRFTLPDTEDGMGQDGSLDVYVNGKKAKTVDLTSYYMWQYFQHPSPYKNGHPDDKLLKEGSTGSFAFDEVHFRLEQPLKKGDKIRIQSSGAKNLVYGVDFLEIEKVEAPITKPENAYSITDYGAIPNDGKDDMDAIQSCIAAAQNDGKDVYFPEGTFNFDSQWRLDASDIKITGAGIWYTNLQFNKSEAGAGGICGSKADHVEFCNMYINSMLRSRYEESAHYKCFSDVWLNNSYIHDIWEDHFECGFWIADYYFEDGTDYSNGLKIANSRIRNNFADGVNFSQGTSDASVFNCSVRNNGDDGLAMWNNNWHVEDEKNNIFCYNTIDLNWRAGGIAVYGGNGHKIYNNYISDTFMATGIHVNTAFQGYHFENNSEGVVFSNNILLRCGTIADSWGGDMGALDLSGDIRNITFNNTYIYDSQHDAIRLLDYPENLVFNNLKVYGTGIDGQRTENYTKDNPGAVFMFGDKIVSAEMIVNGLEYANIAYSDAIYGTRDDCKIKGEKNLGSEYKYDVPKMK